MRERGAMPSVLLALVLAARMGFAKGTMGTFSRSWPKRACVAERFRGRARAMRMNRRRNGDATMEGAIAGLH